MSKRLRVQVTVSYPLLTALEVLGERNGLPVAAQAAMTLRRALQQTIDGAEVQSRVRQHNAQRKHAEWVEETVAERAEELLYAKGQEAARGADEAAPEAEAAGHGAVHALADGGLA